ncbi:MAG: vitamin K epoxide reductase family protein [Nocardioidaceae bacterium]
MTSTRGTRDATDADTARPETTVPGWAVASSLVLAVLGLLDAAYLTFEHYTSSATLACSESATVNCLKVTTSSYADIVGIPVALFGLAYFVAMVLLCLPAAWRRPQLRALRLVAVVVGVLAVLYLVWVELYRVNAICLYCTGVHVITFLLFVVVALAAAFAEPVLAERPAADS